MQELVRGCLLAQGGCKQVAQLLRRFLLLVLRLPLHQAHGNTALHMAAALHCHRNQKEIIQLLLDHGADPSIRNLDNDQPIHMAPPGKAGDQVRPQGN